MTSLYEVSKNNIQGHILKNYIFSWLCNEDKNEKYLQVLCKCSLKPNKETPCYIKIFNCKPRAVPATEKHSINSWWISNAQKPTRRIYHL